MNRIARRLATASVACLAGCAASSAAPRFDLSALPQRNDAYYAAAAARVAGIEAGSEARARNVIVFIGDGMGLTTISAARILAGQRLGRDGESHQLTMDTFPHTALSRTYSHDFQVADSAATATAILSGAKTRSDVIGVNSEVAYHDCAGSAGRALTSIFEIAEAAGLATGIVSTARITHATPAAAYAHVADRDWENDVAAAGAGGGACVDIARQLIEWPAGDGFEIVLGGGRDNFLPTTQADPETPNQRGLRADGRDLIAAWQARSPGHAFVWNAQQLASADLDGGARVLGLFAPSHMAYEQDRARDVGGEPSLAEMTAAAIGRLAQDGDGYVLLVEGGRVDHAHHDGNAARALGDAIALDAAVARALELTRREDTLIVVTADHSHTLTFSGYARRGAPILGLSETANGPILADDGLPYTTLGYANGPGAAQGRRDLRGVDTNALDFRQQALVPMAYETHGGEDVVIYAWGPGDDGFAGTLEQNVIFHLLARALGFGG